MMSLRVELGDRSYPIHIGDSLLGRSDLYDAVLRSNQIMIVSNETVAPLYLDRLRGALGGRDVRVHVLPDGEQYKTLEQLGEVFDSLIGARFGRDCTIVALGGGVVGDMAEVGS